MDISNSDIERFRNSLLKGDRTDCLTIIKSYLDAKIDFKIIYEGIIKIALYDVGRLWEYNKISVASEHLASTVAQSVMNEVFNNITFQDKKTYKILLTCVEHEEHQIGLKMVNDLFEQYGWNTFNLGSNTPTSEINRLIYTLQPDLIAISISLHFHMPSLLLMIDEIRAKNNKVPIIVGGQALTRLEAGTIQKRVGVQILQNLEDTENFIKKFKKNGNQE